MSISMDTINLLSRRRSVPPAFLAGPGPSEAELETMLTIASRVPDHGKLQPWRFIIYAGEARLKASRIVEEAFLAANPGADEGARKKEAARFSQAPLVVGVISTAAPHVKIPLWEQELSAAAVCQNLVIAAAALGYGASWLTGWYAYDAGVGASLGVKPGEKVAGFVHIGRPTETMPDRPRPSLRDIVSHFG
jgi:nitroreductase